MSRGLSHLFNVGHPIWATALKGLCIEDIPSRVWSHLFDRRRLADIPRRHLHEAIDARTVENPGISPPRNHPQRFLSEHRTMLPAVLLKHPKQEAAEGLQVEVRDFLTGFNGLDAVHVSLITPY